MPPTPSSVAQNNIDKEIRKAAAAIIWQLWAMMLITWCVLFLLIHVVSDTNESPIADIANVEKLLRERFKREDGPYKLVHERVEWENVASTLESRSAAGWKLVECEFTLSDPTTNRRVYDLIWSRR